MKFSPVPTPSTEAPRATSFRERLATATPIILTVLATLLAGLSNSEMTLAQYHRSLAAQSQSKAGDLLGLVSPDGLRWRPAGEKPLSMARPFDSHNIAFWDGPTGLYHAYTRGVRKDGTAGRGMEREFEGGLLWVRDATSRDFSYPSALMAWTRPRR